MRRYRYNEMKMRWTKMIPGQKGDRNMCVCECIAMAFAGIYQRELID